MNSIQPSFFWLIVVSPILIIAFAACSNDSSINADIKMYSDTWNQVINEREIELINTNSFDENATVVSASGNIVGLEAFKAHYNNYLTGFSDAEFKIVDIFGQGNKIVKHWNFKGTHDGDFFGIPATGKKVDLSGVTLVKMRNGKIAQEQDFFDSMALMQQLGLIPN